VLGAGLSTSDDISTLSRGKKRPKDIQKFGGMEALDDVHDHSRFLADGKKRAPGCSFCSRQIADRNCNAGLNSEIEKAAF